MSFVCTKFSESKEDAEEIVQDTFVIAFRKVNELRSETLLAYLRKIAVNECFRRRKLNNRRNYHHDLTDIIIDDVHELDKNLLPEDAFLNKERQARLLAEINQLPKVQREAIYLYYYIGFSIQEIAAFMDCSINYVCVNLSRARKTIKRRLEEDRTSKVTVKALVLLPLAALFVAEEAIFVAAYVPLVVAGGAAVGTMASGSGAAVAGTGSVVGYVTAACVAFTVAAAVTFYIALQPESEAVVAQSPTVVEVTAPITTASPTTIPPTTPVVTTSSPETTAPETTPPETTPQPTSPALTIPAPATPAPTTTPPIPVDRTHQVLAALLHIHTRADLERVLAQYDFAFDQQVTTMAGVHLTFYRFNEGAGDILVGSVNSGEWRMQYIFSEGGHVQKDNVDLYIWMRN